MVTCRDCKDVLVKVYDCQLRRCDDNGIHSLAYKCSKCGYRDVVGNLHPTEITELLDAGMVVLPWSKPIELRDAHRESGRPALTLDDLLDFHLILQEDDWFDKFQVAVSDSD